MHIPTDIPHIIHIICTCIHIYLLTHKNEKPKSN